MQPIMEITPEDDRPAPVKHKPGRRPVMFSNFYPFTVFCWVAGVALVGLLVGLICTGCFEAYATLLQDLGKV